MKLYLVSDLHLEFAPFDAARHEQAWREADVIVLAGDIGKWCQGIKWAREAFGDKPVIYVLGNHEYYGHNWLKLIPEAREVAREHKVHFLEDDAVTIDGVRFLGCTLWTDFKLFGIAEQVGCMRATEAVLNDFRRVRSGPPIWKLTAAQTRDRHLLSRAWLEEELATADPARTVVVTHHFTDRGSLAPYYASDPVSAGFGSQLAPALLARAKLWIHGHTHTSFDYTLPDEGDSATRVICNPRGYPMSRASGRFENPAFDPELVIKI